MFYNQEQNNEYYVVNPAGLTMISLEEEDQVEKRTNLCSQSKFLRVCYL